MLCDDLMAETYGDPDAHGNFKDENNNIVPDKRCIITTAVFSYNAGVAAPTILNIHGDNVELKRFAQVLDGKAHAKDKKFDTKLTNSKSVKKEITEHVIHICNCLDKVLVYLVLLIVHDLNYWWCISRQDCLCTRTLSRFKTYKRIS